MLQVINFAIAIIIIMSIIILGNAYLRLAKCMAD
jgi:hypothetical protein